MLLTAASIHQTTNVATARPGPHQAGAMPMQTIASRAESGAAARVRLIKRRPKRRKRPNKRRRLTRKRKPRRRKRPRKKRRLRKKRRPMRRRGRRRRRPRRRLPLIRKLLTPPPLLPVPMLTSVFLLLLKVQSIASQASVAQINILLT